MTTTPSFFRGEQRANTVETGSQFSQQIVGLADGGFVVLWVSDADIGAGSSFGIDIIGQRYDANGDKIGGEFQANTANSLDNEFNFSSAALPNGNFVIVYEDVGANGTSLRFEVLDPSGVRVDDGTIRADPGDDTLGNPSVAVAADGGFLVTYDRGNGHTEVVKVDSAGNVGPSSIAIFHGGSFVNTAATQLANGNFVAISESDTSGSDAGIAFRLISAGGVPLGIVKSVGNTFTNGESDFRPAVTALSGGGFVVSWTNIDPNDDDLQFQLYDAAGNEVGAVRTVKSVGATDNNDDTTLVGLPDGGFALAYTDDVDQTIKVQRFDANGDEVGTAVTVENQGFSTDPHISLSADGRLLVTWGVLDDATDDQDVEFAILDPRDDVINGDNTSEVITSRPGGATVNGNGGNDTLLGQNGFDTIRGGDGNDLIEGGLNLDSLFGDAGNDLIFAFRQDDPDGSASGDTISGGDGNDRIIGSRGDDVIGGDAGKDVLVGGEGDDRLTGGAEKDVLRGGLGNDVYTVNAAGEAIEGANQGVDTVRSTVSYALGANLERLQLLGGGNVNGVGNALDNRLAGNAGANVLNGLGGDDLLTGGAGADRFVFNTALSAATNVDRITDFQAGIDEIRLDDAVFAGLSPGALAAGAFRVGAAAADANDRIIYNDATGALVFDANGSAAGGAVQFAKLDPGLAPNAADFLVV